MRKEEILEMSPYAPIRYQNEYWWKYAVEAGRSEWVMPDGRIASRLPEYVMNHVVIPAIQASEKQIKAEIQDPVEQGHIVGALMAKLMEQRHWVPLAAQFVLCGRQIYDLNDDIVEMLAHTDLGECTLEDWHPPFDSLFVRFGKREDIRQPWEDSFEYLDGAFVSVTPSNDDGTERRIKFGMTMVKENGKGVMMPGYFLDISVDEQRLPVKDAVALALARRLSSFEDQPGDSQTVVALNSHRREEITAAGAVLTDAVTLMVNALFYIESIGTKQNVVPGRDVPPSISAQWASKNAQQREKMKSKLLSQGYSTVYLLGQEVVTGSSGASSAGTKRAHWRRGHWRMQPHGAERAQVKRIWLRPQMIGADRVQDDLPGHVYVVGNNDNPDIRH